MPNKAFKPLAMLARTPSTPRLFAHGFAIIAQTALRTERRLTWRWASEMEWFFIAILVGLPVVVISAKALRGTLKQEVTDARQEIKAAYRAEVEREEKAARESLRNTTASSVVMPRVMFVLGTVVAIAILAAYGKQLDRKEVGLSFWLIPIFSIMFGYWLNRLRLLGDVAYVRVHSFMYGFLFIGIAHMFFGVSLLEKAGA